MAKATMSATDYQAKSQRLDKIMAALQAPDISVDKATEYYEQGIALVSELQAYLQTAENKITKLSQTSGQ